MSAEHTDRYADWDGAYVLGALSPTERREYEEHLLGCPDCRAAVTALAGMPGLLAQVSAEDAGTLLAPAEAGGPDGSSRPVRPSSPTVADPAPTSGRADAPVPLHPRTRPPLRTRLLAVAAGIALVVLGGIGGFSLAQRDATPPVEATQVRLAEVGGSGVTADVRLVPKAWGTSLGWDCSYPTGDYDPDAGVVYELTLVDADGGRTVAATWTNTGSGGATGLSAATDMATESIVAVEIGIVGWDEPLASGTL